MIRPSNIDIANHKSDFKCDQHSGSVVALDLNTDTEYTEGQTGIIIKGSKLTSSCSCITCFPTSNGNQSAQDITAAKTA